MSKQFLSIFVVSILSLCVAVSCVDEKFTTDPSAILHFSCDTLSFDTVFTTIPSRTLSFYVYNNNDRALKISSVRLGRGQDSYFRFNFDGRLPGDANLLEDIEIKANDSLFVFVELTVDPNETDFPVFYMDSMVFITNGQTQDVKLVTYGQDAIIFKGGSLTVNTTFTADKPYLFFGNFFVNEGITLTLDAGTHLYFHDKANLVVNGNLVSNGTLENPVEMRTDRFDKMPDEDKTPYDYMPGQWGGIYLQNSKGSYLLNYTKIKNCDIGIVLVGDASNQPSLKVTNSVIHSMTQYGIYAQYGKLEISNTEISNCGTSCLYILGGESYVVHTTIANYYTWGTRENPSLVIANYILNGNLLYLFPITSSVVENSIVYGNLNTEIALQKDTFTNATYNVLVSNTLLKARKTERDEYYNIIWSNSVNGLALSDTVFMNVSIRDIKTNGYYNFQLDQKSMARGKANKAVAGRFPTDLLGKNRLFDGYPDLGAYEK